jgi:hypothetical protein
MRVEFPFTADVFPSDLGGFISKTVLEGSAPVLYVAHQHDNSWAMTDADGDPNEEGALIVACIWDAIGHDASLSEIAWLPLGWEAVRDGPGEEWRRRPYPDE